MTSRPTSEWARRIPRSSLLSHKDEAIILAYRWRTRLALNDAHLRLRRLMPKLEPLNAVSMSEAPWAQPNRLDRDLSASHHRRPRGPYIFEITVHEVIFHDPDDCLGLFFPVLLAVEEITKDVYAEVATPTPEDFYV